MTVRILRGDCRDVLRELEPESVHCVVTSPPYWGLRDYGVAGQIGIEDNFAGYVEIIRNVFRDVRRVLRNDGTVWLNLGDSYQSGARGGYDRERVGVSKNGGQNASDFAHAPNRLPQIGLKDKDLCGIPWRVAFALQADGWWLRSDIIWSKPNPMPESVTDRPTKAHEYIFLLSKAERYYYDADAIKEPFAEASEARYDYAFGGKKTEALIEANKDGIGQRTRILGNREPRGKAITSPRNDGNTWNENNGRGFIPTSLKRNRRTVWDVATQPFSEAHFATFPPALIEPCILAGCPKQCCAKCGAPWVMRTETAPDDRKPYATVGAGDKASHCRNDGKGMQKVLRADGRGGDLARKQIIQLGSEPSCFCNAATVPGTVLDPFGGAGTTGLVADRLERNCILIELNPEYAAMAERRIRNDAGMFAEVI